MRTATLNRPSARSTARRAAAGALLAALAVVPAGAATAASGRDLARLWAPYQELLDRHLEEKITPRGGLVSAFDYRAALADERTGGLLSRQSGALARLDPDALDTREAAVSFWLNAYNYFMIEHILHNPHRGDLITSVRDYGSLLNPYRVFRRDLFDVGGRSYSLSGIENDILLGEEFAARGWKEARVHFSVNCAAVGCPPLRARIYLPDNVDALLSDNTRRAFNTKRHLHLDGDTLHVTRLFDWYDDDFVAEAGSIETFIRTYADDPVREQVGRAERLRFIDYDWTLNSPENFPELRGG